MKNVILAAALALSSTAAFAEPVKYSFDASHSQVIFSYKHFGFSTTFGMFSGFDGEIMFDADAPATSSVTVSMPVKSMFTGWEKRDGHFQSPDFFGSSGEELVSFKSTSIEVTGDNTAMITGDMTINGVTKSVALDTVMNKSGAHPMAGKAWLGFDAKATILRSDYGLGKFAPNVSDEVDLMISIEAGAAG